MEPEQQDLADYVAEPIIDKMIMLKPDDFVIFRYNLPMISQQQAAEARKAIEKAAPRLNFLIMGSDWDIAAVLRKPDTGFSSQLSNE